MNSKHLSQQNDYIGLTFIAKFGLLRAQELGLLMWPNTVRDGYQQARRIAVFWKDYGLILERIFPEGHGRAFVLTKKGAELLKKLEPIVAARGTELIREPGLTYRSGVNIGSMNDGVWTPPASWKHDLISHGVLARLHTLGWTIYPENQVRMANDCIGKVPDGLARRGEDVLWLETECAIKNSRKKQKPLVQGLELAAAGNLAKVMGMQPTMTAVAFDVDAIDSRDFRLDHRTRVTSAMQKIIKQDLTLTWLECKTENFGVKSMEFVEDVVRASPGIKVLQVMNASGWNRVPGRDYATQVYYTDYRAEVGKSPETNTFYHQIDDGPRIPAPNLTAAKHDAANNVAILTGSK